MSSPNGLPVYGPDKQLLYYAPAERVQRLIDEGRVRAVGTKRRIRAVIATSGESAGLLALLLALAKPRAGTKFSHNAEADDNPRGVWTFRRIHA